MEYIDYMDSSDIASLQMRSRIKSISISDFRVIKSLTLEFPNTGGNIWVIGGRNGIGKTTVLNACYRLIKDKWSQDEHIQGSIEHNLARVVYIEENRTVEHNYKRINLLLQVQMDIWDNYPSYGRLHLLYMMEKIANCQVIPSRPISHFILIDNPELCLDIDLQCRFMSWLANFPEHQFIIATHSEHIMNAVPIEHRFFLHASETLEDSINMIQHKLYVTGSRNDKM